MYIDNLLRIFRDNAASDALVWDDRVHSYAGMAESVRHWIERLNARSVGPGDVVSLEGDFTPNAVALMLALVERACVVVPLIGSAEARKQALRSIAEVEHVIEVSGSDEVETRPTGARATHPLLADLRAAGHPGLVLFSSGSTGTSKAALHDFVPLLAKFEVRRHTLRTLAFLLFDHIGGINTLLYVLSNGGCLVTVPDRSPDAVCAAIEKYGVQLLPTSPTFLNLMLVSGAHERHDLSSLQFITYGTEVMPAITLKRLHELLPGVRIQQTYGLSEVGILRSKSRASDSVWMKIGGEGFETRVVDGMLEIRARSAMLGYLNASSPFTEDGWLKTGDAVEVDGGYIRVLGRRSEIINVGGVKVYPAEVENVIQMLAGVEQVVVSGMSNPIVGQVVAARVRLSTSETAEEFRKRMWKFCRDKLERYKIPQKITLESEDLHGERFKKTRGA